MKHVEECWVCLGAVVNSTEGFVILQAYPGILAQFSAGSSSELSLSHLLLHRKRRNN